MRNGSSCGAWPVDAAAAVAVAALAWAAGAGNSAEGAYAARACSVDVGSLAPARQFGTLRGDVDGNGSADRVFISIARQAPSRCRFLLVATVGGRNLVAPVTHRWYPRATPSYVSRYLQLESLIALRPRGLDIVVSVDRGATTDSVAIFTAEDGNLRRRWISGHGSEHLFVHGGSVTHQNGVDCKRPRSRVLLVSGGGPLAGAWQVERRVYRAARTGPLQPTATTRYRVRNVDAAVKGFPELGSAFPSCTVARPSR